MMESMFQSSDISRNFSVRNGWCIKSPSGKLSGCLCSSFSAHHGNTLYSLVLLRRQFIQNVKPYFLGRDKRKNTGPSFSKHH